MRPDQLADEVNELLGEISEVYGWFGLEPRFTFATRPDDALGELAQWERAEQYIVDALERAGVEYTVKPGDGAFYAPKIDIYVDDALGREWQMATIQADMMMLPERFDLTYIDEDGQPQRPIAIHRAVYGSMERFIGIITEHFGGAFPLWCAPVQASIIPIADRHNESAAELAEVLRSQGSSSWRSTTAGNRMQKKIKLAQDQKIPYMLVLGDREVESSHRCAADAGRRAARADRLGGSRRPARRAGGQQAPRLSHSASRTRACVSLPPGLSRAFVCYIPPATRAGRGLVSRRAWEAKSEHSIVVRE